MAFYDKYGWEYEVMEPQKMNPRREHLPAPASLLSAQIVRRQLRRRRGRPGVAAPNSKPNKEE